MKYCKDCCFFKAPNYCNSPKNGTSLVTKKPTVRFATMNREDYPWRCGPTGKYFEAVQAVVVKRPWWKLW